ncbi:NHLP leader peptide family natural product precursor [Microvirga tunisiensis]|uniref:NHLP leader peptide family natural product n=2 Tax=Pannonibacter tanglangensis TaxID=2750084 RepID=A0ABW9ZNE4_9HYPH|nr:MULTISPECIES: NHLP leader peptide family RiPP precursor [unclassified Pannonibacter]NBN65091.1 NHLP leader peptide family natural product precursor [Pannonibacter sp. XCT-34]NBN79933.1 NHLP leader peptide family natural product precursor [Pannonibacter sp. XCT-53]
MSDTAQIFERARQHVEAAVVEKAMSDAAFRKMLVTAPHQAIRELLGVDPIPNMVIRVIEEQPGEVTLVLPRSIAEDELPDELLDLASGGSGMSFPGGRKLLELCYKGPIGPGPNGILPQA